MRGCAQSLAQVVRMHEAAAVLRCAALYGVSLYKVTQCVLSDPGVRRCPGWLLLFLLYLFAIM